MNIIERLSPAEKNVAKLVSIGLCNQEIADRLFISLKTVEHHMHNIYTKLLDVMDGRNERVFLALSYHKYSGDAEAFHEALSKV